MTAPRFPQDTFVVLGDEALCGGIVLSRVHLEEVCAGRPCVIHNRTEHLMRTWPLIWVNNARAFYRLCEHRIPHPDPDQYEHWAMTGQFFRVGHPCCSSSCCRPVWDEMRGRHAA